jgi:hypothetical protein
MSADDFIALPTEKKNRIAAELAAMTPEMMRARSKPSNSTERAERKRFADRPESRRS